MGMTLPLDGFVVVALEQAVAPPLCTRHLGDLGARVIKCGMAELAAGGPVSHGRTPRTGSPGSTSRGQASLTGPV